MVADWRAAGEGAGLRIFPQMAMRSPIKWAWSFAYSRAMTSLSLVPCVCTRELAYLAPTGTSPVGTPIAPQHLLTSMKTPNRRFDAAEHGPAEQR